ncbi:MAG: hypothetical protein RIF33_23670 [Cyclobacteriaceae bacterium]
MSSEIADIRKSLLFTLKPLQIDALIQEAELERLGYSFNYIVDPYDIIDYCFPIGLRERATKSNVYLSADRQNGYYYFFRNKSCLLTKEYGKEFRILHFGKIKKYFNRVKYIEKKVTPYLNAIESESKFLKNKNQIEEFVRDNMSLLSAMALGISQDSSHRYHVLFNDVLVNEIDNKAFDQIEYEEGDDILFQRVYAKYVDIIKAKPDDYYKNIARRVDEPFDFVKETRQKWEENSAFYDASAMTKAIAANNIFIERKSKKLSLYFSSAEWSYDVYENSMGDLPKLDANEFLFHRNIAQIFAQLVFRGYYNKDIEQYIQRLEILKRLISQSSLIDQNEFQEMRKDLEDTRNTLENVGLMLEYKETKDHLVAASKFSAGEDYNVVADILRKVNKYLKENIKLNKGLDSIDYYMIKVDRKINILNIIGDTDLSNSRNFGLDPIESLNQQLPVVFDYGTFNSKKKLKDIIRAICYYYLQYDLSKYQESSFKEVLKKNLNDFAEESDERMLVESLAYLIVPISIDEPELKPNEIVFDQTSFLIKKREASCKDNATNTAGIIRELKYIQVWAARRSQKYSTGLKLSKKYSNEYPDDPRFYHSQALTIYSWITDFEEDKVSEEPPRDVKIQQGIQLVEEALERYMSFKKKKMYGADFAIEALWNTLAHFYIIAAADFIENQPLKAKDSISRSRDAAVELKDILKRKKKNIRKIPEYYSTEALLEYNEYLVLKFEEASKATLLKKLYHSRNAMKESIDRSKYNSQKTISKKESLLERIENAIDLEETHISPDSR